MDLPHAPYLFFMGVGDYAIIKDKYKAIPIDYYVEKEYAPLARQIFGDTPAMMAFFGQLLGMEYPWPKYAQIVGRDYVSGAMENTTSTLHGTGAYQNARQLKDGNRWEVVVAHELFHQWFGDLVTAESWSNLTVNESFADYSEYLWLEHKYGKDHALAYNHEAMQGYFGVGNNIAKHLVRFQYDDKEEMFDGVSYQKGGRIQNMLRQYVGDSAYFAAMQLYLQQNRFKPAEAHQWRLALEEVSGKDLNWFFDQWYFSSGHPMVRLKYLHNDSSKTMQVVIQQQQKDKIFHLPVDIDVYTKGKPERMTWWTRSESDTVNINYEVQPEWINVDPQRMMLWEKQNQQDHQQWIAQARFAKNHIEKLEVLEYFTGKWKNDPASYAVLEKMLKDEYAGTRKAVLNLLRKGTIKSTPALLAQVKTLAGTEKDLPTRAYAIDVLALEPLPQDLALFSAAVKDSSYSVAAAGLEAMARLAPDQAIALTPSLKDDAKGRLLLAVKIADYLNKDTAQAAEVIEQFRKLQIYDRILEANAMLYFANRLTDLASFRKATAMVLEAHRILRTDLQGLQTGIMSTVRWMMKQREIALQQNPGNETAKEQLKYLKDKSGW
ncbi:MAG: hypothetical protein MUF29_08915 [Chitinophagaceae bacterium]|nr:hypothetical protein [Chitinophagaceae bacterium]